MKAWGTNGTPVWSPDGSKFAFVSNRVDHSLIGVYSLQTRGVTFLAPSVDHDTIIGRHAFVSPGAVLCADVAIGDSAFVGAGAIVLPGRRIGAGAIVGAGSIVTRDVADGAVVRGNPAHKDLNRS